MKPLFLSISFFIAFFVMGSCNKQTETKVSNHDGSKALEVEKTDLPDYSSGRYNDMVEDIYKDLVDKSPELKKLEEDYEVLNSKINDPFNAFNDYDGKSSNYYNSANDKISSIGDSVLKEKMQALLLSSRNTYGGKTTTLQALLQSIKQNNISLKDHHTILKIVLTLPTIDNYQNDNLPDKNQITPMLKEQKQLLEYTKRITPAY